MPTRGRQALAKLAVECFLSQTHADRDLVILDDHDDPSFPFGYDHPLIRYYALDYTVGKLNIPQKRNWVNGLAKGQTICHWDSDDYSAPTRLEQQMQLMETSGKQVVGYSSMFFYDEASDRAFHWESARNIYALGTSLVYRKEFWQAHPYIEGYFVGSDNMFVKAALNAGQLVSVHAGPMMVARVHANNTSEKRLRDPGYHPVPLERLPVEFRNICPAREVTR